MGIYSVWASVSEAPMEVAPLWPFKKEETGFSLDRYSLTPEEKREVSVTFESFAAPDGRKIGSEHRSGAVTRGLVAYALWNYAEQLMVTADMSGDSLGRETVLNKAIGAVKKAYQIHNLPIYLFDLARYLAANGRLSAADQAYKAFLEDQADYRPGEGDYMFLYNRDIPKAIVDAKDALDQL